MKESKSRTPEFDYFEGWRYVTTIFNYLQEKSNEKIASHIAPRYIYRGITKRYFTESEKINSFKSLLISDLKNYNKNDLHISDNQIASYAQSGMNGYKESLKKRSSKNEWLRKITDLKPSQIYNILYNNLKKPLKSGQLDPIPTEGLTPEMSLIKELVKNNLYQYIVPEQIHSGASVRLRDTTNDYSSLADYLAYLKKLISGFKIVNPEYKSFDDLEILAEIQHRGGGSCLVDFSNNFLISLWFAVNNDMNDIGYLFCYDVNADSFLENNLTYLTKDKWSNGIEELLRETYSETSYFNQERTKFWLWKPMNINGRIARQDSIFIFGIEKFKIKDHKVDVIPIPPQWKEPILRFLKVYMGITTTFIYPDLDGYAASHSKIAPINDTTIYINPCVNTKQEFGRPLFDLSSVQKGMSSLLGGNYWLALEYFLKSESQMNIESNGLKQMPRNSHSLTLQTIELEVLYSIGLCYSKLNNHSEALNYYKKAVNLAMEILTDQEFNCDNPTDRNVCDISELFIKDRQPHNSDDEGIHGKRAEAKPISCRTKDPKSTSLVVGNVNISLTSKKIFKIFDDYIDSIIVNKSFEIGIRFLDLIINCCPHLRENSNLRIMQRYMKVANLLLQKNIPIPSEDMTATYKYSPSPLYIVDNYICLIYLFMIKSNNEPAGNGKDKSKGDIKEKLHDEEKKRKEDKAKTEKAILRLKGNLDTAISDIIKNEISSPLPHYHLAELHEQAIEYFNDRPDISSYLSQQYNKIRNLIPHISSKRSVNWNMDYD